MDSFRADISVWVRAVAGEAPRDSTPEHGLELIERSLEALKQLIEES